MTRARGPVFIVGVPRSGTTVLANKVMDATGVAIAPETHFLPEVWSPMRNRALERGDALREVLRRFEAGRWFGDLGLTVWEIEKEFGLERRKDWPTLFETILRLHARARGFDRWGEKTPGHYRFMEELLAWYPYGRIILVLRDPRAVVYSNRRVPFSAPYAWFTARRWREALRIYERCADDDRVMLLKYEDFIASPGETLAEVAEFMGGAVRRPVAFGGRMDRSGASGWRAHHLQSARKEVSESSAERWVGRLPDHDVWLAQWIAGRRLRAYGYRERPFSGPRRALNVIRFVAEFIPQRIGLSIDWAERPSHRDRPVVTRWKASLLRLVGACEDLVWTAIVRCRSALGRRGAQVPDRGYVDIRLGADHRQRSSHAPLSAEAEIVGMFIQGLVDLGIDVTILASDREQVNCARRIAFSFKPDRPVTIRYTRRRADREAQGLDVEVMMNGRSLYSAQSLHLRTGSLETHLTDVARALDPAATAT